MRSDTTNGDRNKQWIRRHSYRNRKMKFINITRAPKNIKTKLIQLNIKVQSLICLVSCQKVLFVKRNGVKEHINLQQKKNTYRPCSKMCFYLIPIYGHMHWISYTTKVRICISVCADHKRGVTSCICHAFSVGCSFHFRQNLTRAFEGMMERRWSCPCLKFFLPWTLISLVVSSAVAK